MKSPNLNLEMTISDMHAADKHKDEDKFTLSNLPNGPVKQPVPSRVLVGEGLGQCQAGVCFFSVDRGTTIVLEAGVCCRR